MGDWVVVYRGFAVPTLDMIEAMLQAEGLAPRRLGKASPALLGLGDSGVEQRIEVPREHEEAALALIAGSGQAPEQSDDLEAQALSVPAESASEPELRGFDLRFIVLFVVVAVVVLLWLRCGSLHDAGEDGAQTGTFQGPIAPTVPARNSLVN